MHSTSATSNTVRYLLYAFAGATVLAMSATTVVLILLIAVLLRDLYKRNVRAGDFKKDSLLYVALFSWKAFTRALATSIREVTSIKGVWDRIPYAVIGFYRIDRKTVLRILHILFIANSIIVVYALAQRYLDVPWIYRPLFSEPTRISGYFGHPNQYAGCVSIVLLVNLCLALYQDKRFFAYTVFLLLGLIYAGSRSYFLGVAACSAVLMLSRGSFRSMIVYSVVSLLAVAVISLSVPWFKQRVLSSFSVEQNTLRLNFWKASWDVFREHPLTGVGSSMLPKYLEPAMKQGLIDNTAHAHSIYIQSLAEDGIPGFVLVVGVQLYFLVKYFRVFLRNKEPLLRSLGLGVSLSFLNLLVAGIFEHTFGAAIVAMNINFLMGVVEGYRLSEPAPEEGTAV